MPAGPTDSVRERLATAAFDLFDAQGFDTTTVDEIAQRAGVGRTTFFRHFGSKEAVVFPQHDVLLTRIHDRLSASDPASRDLAVIEAARLVLRYYVAEGERARIRYRLVRSVPALRSREIAGIRQYQHVFTRALAAWAGDETHAHLRAELLASAVVTANNHVLRRWLRGESDEPEADFADAMAIVLDQPSTTLETSVVVIRSPAAPEAVTAAVRRALRDV